MGQPRRTPGPIGGRLVSAGGLGEVLLWILVVGVAITALVVFVALASRGG